MSAPRIPCRACGGCGTIELPELLVELLAVIQRHGAVTAPELAADASARGYTSVTAFNNQLETLRTLGLVERKKYGRRYRYEVATKEERATVTSPSPEAEQIPRRRTSGSSRRPAPASVAAPRRSP